MKNGNLKNEKFDSLLLFYKMNECVLEFYSAGDSEIFFNLKGSDSHISFIFDDCEDAEYFYNKYVS